MTKHLVSPSILAGDFVNMERSVRSLREWGADLVHCDVMDGVYVKNITFGMPMIKAIKGIAELPLDVHLMITEPERYVEEFVKCGADYLTFHPEASKSPLETLKKIRALGCKAGIVLNPNIEFKDWAYLLPECDMILIMSVYAGLGGQKFIAEMLDKVKEAKAYITENNLPVVIEIDGGVGEANAKEVRDAGVDILVAGSAVYRSDDPARTINIIRGE
ncbi:MAG: ribulose-phosphate 3-epimerase [Clostridia bacterium]|nr:ribulose-phosphate 3-epimerase [Clostridia bacterium]